jgi:AcrR family transcriptional regulator
MARKAKSRKSSIGGGSAEDRVIDAALKLAADKGWRGATLADIADAAGISAAEMFSLFPTKAAILGAFTRRIDRVTLAGVEPGGGADGSSVRDRLFDIFMRRFDALAPHKAAMNNMVVELPRTPLPALCAGARLLHSVAWMASAAGVSTRGPLGALRVKALTALYLSVLRVWLGDEGEDHAKTMAALDKALKRAEMMAQSFPFRRGAEPASGQTSSR